jgi:prophage regulatory protein
VHLVEGHACLPPEGTARFTASPLRCRVLMRFVRTKDVLQMLGVSRTTLWRMVQAGSFPQPIVISRRATGHLLDEVEAWMAARTEGSQTGAEFVPAAAGPRRPASSGTASSALPSIRGNPPVPSGRRRRRGRG